MFPIVLCLLAQAPAPSDEVIKVAVPNLKLANMDDKLADFYSSHLAQQLSYHGVRTITSSEIAALLGLERQRQLLGCPDEGCKADVLKSLGVDGIVVGTVTKLDRSYQLDVRVISATDGQALAGASSNSQDNDALVGTFTVVADQLSRQLAQRMNRKLGIAPGTEVVLRASRVKRFSWVPLAVGGAAAIVGGVFLGLARGTYSELTRPRPDPADHLKGTAPNDLAAMGQSQQTIGFIMIAAGGACVVTAALMFLLGGNDTVQAGVAIVPGGGSLGLSGVW